ncbi:fimbrial protein [Serratia marcescens]|uniref:fimbrial protein n=1 Tax=Serratia nevei TaxID=2703794 RepID=UPI0018D3BD4E|nr:fimbrial protein [Serratia marcescens]MBH2844194.1 fimbrial protein [Serratia marcescens]MBH2863992.1 fimbrial protein [Serratia marcescens]MBN5378623.1 fimbrial protein [Serratia marcescens]
MNLSRRVISAAYLSFPLAMLLSAWMVHAAAQGEMVFYGTLNNPPVCTINNGQKIDVDFGEKLGVDKIDGNNYLQKINYQVSCEPGVAGMALGLTLSGPVSGFDKAALQTNMPDLAIRILNNGQPLELNKRINIDFSELPELEAVPVKKIGSNLTSGAFSVTGTLLADYL